MTATDTPSRQHSAGADPAADWPGIAMATVVGGVGGGLATVVAPIAMGREICVGAAFGLVFAMALRGRALGGAGAGLIWGLGSGLMLWIVLPTVGALVHLGGFSPEAMLGDARVSFPDFVACIVCIGAPVGVFLGIRANVMAPVATLHWNRAIVAGGVAGLVASLIFTGWMYVGDFYPLISGLGTLGTHSKTVALHFAAACLIGCTFGALFQAEVRNLGSSMGWGMAYAMFWWFVGPMTVFPMAAGRRADWSAETASGLFGSLVGYILYGLILGVIYAWVNAVWTRLFVDADPLNRKREGPGVRLFRSLGWGAVAGFFGGLIALPLMIRTGVVTRLAGLDTGLSTAIGVGLHLGVSTLIGASYGVLFRGEATNFVFSSLWGFVVGLIWWYAGPLTLLPLLRTGQCDWRPEAAAALLPSLVGHLVFGVVTASIFLVFEWRYTSRLFVSPGLAAAVTSRTGAIVTPAPALWVFVLGVGVLLPILLS